MVAGRLVARLAVIELYPLDRALLLQPAKGPKHGGEIGLQPALVQAARELVDRPAASRPLGEQLDDGGPDVAWAGDAAILAITQVACETLYVPAGWGSKVRRGRRLWGGLLEPAWNRVPWCPSSG